MIKLFSQKPRLLHVLRHLRVCLVHFHLVTLQRSTPACSIFVQLVLRRRKNDKNWTSSADQRTNWIDCREFCAQAIDTTKTLLTRKSFLVVVGICSHRLFNCFWRWMQGRQHHQQVRCQLKQQANRNWYKLIRDPDSSLIANGTHSTRHHRWFPTTQINFQFLLPIFQSRFYLLRNRYWNQTNEIFGLSVLRRCLTEVIQPRKVVQRPGPTPRL